MKKYTAHITKLSTGETRLKEFKIYSEDAEDELRYMWGDGNYGCSCNRGIFWEGFDVIPDDYTRESCSDGYEHYHVKCIGEDGSVLYEDLER